MVYKTASVLESDLLDNILDWPTGWCISAKAIVSTN